MSQQRRVGRRARAGGLATESARAGLSRWRQARWQRAPGSASTRFVSARPRAAVPEDTLVRVLGQVVMGPEAGAGQGESKKTRFSLAVHSVDASPMEARAVVTVVEGVPDLAPGDEVAFSARLFLPRGFANPGLPDARLLSKAQGVDLLASVRSAADIQIVSGLEGSGLAAPTSGFSPALGHGTGDQSAPRRSCGGFRAHHGSGRAHRGIVRCRRGVSRGRGHARSVGFGTAPGGGRSAGLRAAAPAGLAGPPMVLARECDGSGRSAVAARSGAVHLAHR